MTDSFTLRSLTEADWPWVVSLTNQTAYEPFMTLEEMARRQEMRPPEPGRIQAAAVDADGAPVGFGLAHPAPGRESGYFEVEIRVAPPHRGRGAGRLLWAAAEGWLAGQGAQSVLASVREVDEDALAWAERRGFRREDLNFKAALDLTCWEATPFAAVIRGAESAGLRFSTLAAEGPGEDSYQRLYDLLDPIMSDVPGLTGRRRPAYDRWRANMQADSGWDPSLLYLAIDGDRWAAMAVVRPLTEGALFHAMTGVDRPYRGRGLSLALKAFLLADLQRRGYSQVATTTHSGNGAMNAVNRRLGYRAKPGTYALVRS